MKKPRERSQRKSTCNLETLSGWPRSRFETWVSRKYVQPEHPGLKSETRATHSLTGVHRIELPATPGLLHPASPGKAREGLQPQTCAGRPPRHSTPSIATSKTTHCPHSETQPAT